MLKPLLSNSEVATTTYSSLCHFHHTLHTLHPLLTNKIEVAQDVTNYKFKFSWFSPSSDSLNKNTHHLIMVSSPRQSTFH